MSKKSRVAQRGVQRRKPRTRKHVELIAHATSSSRREETKAQEETLIELTADHGSRRSTPVAVQEEMREDGTTTHKESASARLAARKAAPLMTAEELAYVKHDLITIGSLSGVMLTIILVLYLFLG